MADHPFPQMAGLAAMTMRCRWTSVEERIPLRAGKFVVEVDGGFDMVYLSTRSFNPSNPEGQRWINMGEGEQVTHWLEGLQSVGECESVRSFAEGAAHA